jgi:hypothetical protein
MTSLGKLLVLSYMSATRSKEISIWSLHSTERRFMLISVWFGFWGEVLSSERSATHARSRPPTLSYAPPPSHTQWDWGDRTGRGGLDTHGMAHTRTRSESVKGRVCYTAPQNRLNLLSFSFEPALDSQFPDRYGHRFGFMRLVLTVFIQIIYPRF